MKETFFETICVLDGAAMHLEYHQKRYESVLASLNAKSFKNLKDYIKPPSRGLYRCKVVYDATSLSIEYFEYKKRDIKKLKLVYDDDIEYSLKSSSREQLDDLFSKKGSFDDVLIVKNSLITDTSIANVAFLKDGIWYSPKKPLLCGTTRQRLLDAKKIVLKDISVDELSDYDGVALMNAMIDFDIITQDNIKDTIC